MFSPRVYRTGLAVAALALIVLAFSLTDQQGALKPTLAPQAFSGANVQKNMSTMGSAGAGVSPGSFDDENVATQVKNALAGYGFSPQTTTYTATTVDGPRTLEDVVGVKAGITPGSIVIVANRDASAPAGLSGTATLMELARVLQGETLNRTIVLASSSGTQGAAGAIHLASTLGGPIDGVIVLGDLASAHISQPILLPWSTTTRVAPPGLINTLSSALASQASLTASTRGIGAQFARLAFPFTLGSQAPFVNAGIPAVQLSLSGERGPSSNEALASSAQLTAVGRAVLAAISGLDNGPLVGAPSSYLLFDGKVVPGWAVSLFVLALLFPVAITTIDGVARVRRRGHVIWRSLVLVLAAAVPFALAAGVVLLARVTGVIAYAPSGPLGPGAIPLHGSGITVLALAALVAGVAAAGVAVFARRFRAGYERDRRAARAARADRFVPIAGPAAARARQLDRSVEGIAVAAMVVACAVTAAIWVTNPFAAALLVPALHLWLWAVNPEWRLGFGARLTMIVLGLAPVVLVLVYYSGALGFGPLGLAWEATLLLAGHGISIVAALEWSVVLGCLAAVTAIAVLAARESRMAPAPVTVRGPVTYAGPGSLGGTKSALRR